MISNSLVSYTYPQGMTVAQLKEIIKDWPEVDKDGNPCTVWVGDASGISNDVVGVSPLDPKIDGSADIIFEF